MPPKGSKKTKDTLSKPASKTAPNQGEISKKSSVSSEDKKPLEVKKLKTVSNVPSHTSVALRACFEGDASNAKAKWKSPEYVLRLALFSPEVFTAHRVEIVQDGPMKGCTAIYFKPPEVFKILELPIELQDRIVSMYLANKGDMKASICINSKRNHQNLWARQYAESNKNRLALLRTCKALNVLGTRKLYGKTLRFDTGLAFEQFVRQICQPNLQMIKEIQILTIKKGDNSLHNLPMLAPNVERMTIMTDLPLSEDPTTAATHFYTAVGGFVNRFAEIRKQGDSTYTRARALSMIKFGEHAFARWEGDKEKIATFLDVLKAKVK